MLRGLMRAARDCVHPQVELDADLPMDFERHAATRALTPGPAGLSPRAHRLARHHSRRLRWRGQFSLAAIQHATRNVSRPCTIPRTTCTLWSSRQGTSRRRILHVASAGVRCVRSPTCSLRPLAPRPLGPSAETRPSAAIRSSGMPRRAERGQADRIAAKLPWRRLALLAH